MQAKDNSCRRLNDEINGFRLQVDELKMEVCKLKLLLENKDDALEKLKNHLAACKIPQ